MKNRKKFVFGTLFLSILFVACTSVSQQTEVRELYLNNRAPLQKKPYIELPLGDIKPQGWLKEMLVRQKNGLTGNLDEIYPLVMGSNNGWLGGDGDQWERGPYWIDGLLPLAYLLEDKELIDKTTPWIEWAFQSQQENGYFGPQKDYENNIPGVQRDNCEDWWPKMVVLKVLQQYYSTTNDERVLELMTRYFKYQLKMLPENPLDHWTFWPRYRGGDNLMSIYWLYNHTGDPFLLELGEIVYKQTYPFAETFNQEHWWHTGSMHCVNLGQGMKTPAIYYQRKGDKELLKTAKKGLEDINRYISGPHGVIIGDEALHGNNPTQGSELCTAVETMFSLEQMLQITGDLQYASQLERIAFNALPAQTTDDYMNRQYFQQVNQVEISQKDRNFDTNHHGTDICFGLFSGYPCCTANMHQGWPKFVQNLFYATPDAGVAALVYAPSTVKMKVADGQEITINEETNYPFEESINFTLSMNTSASFGFELRIPEWCSAPQLKINNESFRLDNSDNTVSVKDGIIKIRREWKDNDRIELLLPMEIRLTEWYERSKAVERGPLVYSLKIEDKWQWKDNRIEAEFYGNGFWEVYPQSIWNYGLIETAEENLAHQYRVENNNTIHNFPWNKENAPIEIKTYAHRIPNWNLYNGSAGPIPYSIAWGAPHEAEKTEITLIPYGCTTLRITEFPVIGDYTIK